MYFMTKVYKVVGVRKQFRKNLHVNIIVSGHVRKLACFFLGGGGGGGGVHRFPPLITRK